ncbi:uncharacterized protein PITG_08105 [Phytophthora infestans T30-4]|uniref:Uncharacterized protein n=1 Tax=Phytophthora infestans (strain T30-4) TaxID=403677 RepID=D0N9H2_PHYIT|nr:uncharacterized protein PITG_08105 [Phytophthora infestans T30-4]EEY54460.1 conserved hypothetical protein [Phytophthora infestans T30-4]|eukprot:XP_002904282.1 conserved hypothetical protein [Phytophthora infestans T30-4]
MTSSSVFSFSPLQSKSADLSMEGRAQENAQKKLEIAPNWEPDGWPITLDQTRHDFRRRFRMRRSLFETIVNTLVGDEYSNYFVQRHDATGLPGFLPEQKVTCALRMLAYGASADQMDELIRIGESTALETLKTFCGSIIRLFGDEYLRKPTRFDIEVLLDKNAARGFPGMIGRLDCMYWSWKNCPTAWAGVYRGLNHVTFALKPELRLAAGDALRKRSDQFKVG